VNQPRRPFRINVGFLINQPIGFSREIPFSLEAYQFPNGGKTETLSGTITLIRTQTGVQAVMDFSALVDAQCVRCLEGFKQPLHTNFQELYTFSLESISEDEETIPEDGYLDFEEAINDYIFLEYPINPLCKPDCRGLCMICGQNLNIGPCEHIANKATE
jgi:uncharacterized protein